MSYQLQCVARLAKKQHGGRLIAHICMMRPKEVLYPQKLAEKIGFPPERAFDYTNLLEGAGLVEKQKTGVRNGVLLEVTQSLLRPYLIQFAPKQKTERPVAAEQ